MPTPQEIDALLGRSSLASAPAKLQPLKPAGKVTADDITSLIQRSPQSDPTVPPPESEYKPSFTNMLRMAGAGAQEFLGKPGSLVTEATHQNPSDIGKPMLAFGARTLGLAAGIAAPELLPTIPGVVGSAAAGAVSGAAASGVERLAEGDFTHVIPRTLEGGLIGAAFGPVIYGGSKFLGMLGSKLANFTKDTPIEDVAAFDQKAQDSWMTDPNARKKLQTQMFSEIKGNKIHAPLRDDGTRFADMSQFVGRPVQSSKELSIPELLDYNNYLKGFRYADEIEPQSLLRFNKMIQATRGQLLDVPPQGNGLWSSLVGVQRYAGTSIGSALNKMGTAGRILGQKLVGAGDAALNEAAPHFYALRDAISPLNKLERENLVDAIQAEATPLNPKVQTALDTWNTVRSDIAARTKTVGLRIYDPSKKAWVAWEELPNYFPRMYTRESLRALNPDDLSSTLQKVIDGGYAKTPQEAFELLTQRMKKTPEALAKNLQFRRFTDLEGYERDPEKVLLNYVVDAHNRIEGARVFGGRNEIAETLLGHIGQTQGKGAADIARNGIETFFNYKPYDGKDLYSAFRSVSVPTMLSFTSTLKHLSSQLTNTVDRVGFANAVRAVPEFLRSMGTPEGSEFVRKTGVLIRELIPELMGSEGTKITQGYTKLIGLRGIMQRQRLFSALAGGHYGDALAERLGGATQDMNLLGQVRGLGLDPEAVIRQGGVLTDAQRVQAARAVVNDTQLMSRAVDLPAFKNSAGGQFLLFLKSSAFQQSKTVKDFVAKPALQFIATRGQRGSLGPLMRFITMSGVTGVPVGMLIQGIKEVTRGSKPKQDMGPLLNAADSAMDAAHLGVVSEMWKSAEQGKDAFVSWMGGPAASLVGESAQDLAQVFQGNPEYLEDSALRRVPFIGPRLASEFVKLPQKK